MSCILHTAKADLLLNSLNGDGVPLIVLPPEKKKLYNCLAQSKNKNFFLPQTEYLNYFFQIFSKEPEIFQAWLTNYLTKKNVDYFIDTNFSLAAAYLFQTELAYQKLCQKYLKNYHRLPVAQRAILAKIFSFCLDNEHWLDFVEKQYPQKVSEDVKFEIRKCFFDNEVISERGTRLTFELFPGELNLVREHRAARWFTENNFCFDFQKNLTDFVGEGSPLSFAEKVEFLLRRQNSEADYDLLLRLGMNSDNLAAYWFLILKDRLELSEVYVGVKDSLFQYSPFPQECIQFFLNFIQQHGEEKIPHKDITYHQDLLEQFYSRQRWHSENSLAYILIPLAINPSRMTAEEIERFYLFADHYQEKESECYDLPAFRKENWQVLLAAANLAYLTKNTALYQKYCSDLKRPEFKKCFNFSILKLLPQKIQKDVFEKSSEKFLQQLSRSPRKFMQTSNNSLCFLYSNQKEQTCEDEEIFGHFQTIARLKPENFAQSIRNYLDTASYDELDFLYNRLLDLSLSVNDEKKYSLPKIFFQTHWEQLKETFSNYENEPLVMLQKTSRLCYKLLSHEPELIHLIEEKDLEAMASVIEQRQKANPAYAQEMADLCLSLLSKKGKEKKSLEMLECCCNYLKPFRVNSEIEERELLNAYKSAKLRIKLRTKNQA